jgi:S-adenosylmethionine/arginine decarboxylase-like enzyme
VLVCTSYVCVHTPIKLDLLGFSGIDVFVCGLHDHEVIITIHTNLYCYSRSHNCSFVLLCF